MKVRNDTGVPNLLIAAVVLSCAAPAGALNVWPRIEQMLVEGFTGYNFGTALLVSMSALGMTAIPFAMKKAENWGFWTVCLALGTFLVGLNYVLAVGAIGKAKDHETNSAASIISQSEQLKAKIKELKTASSEAPKFKWTSEEMVASAREAVELAKQARDQECGKVGDNCRARVAQLASRQSDLAEALQQRAATRTSEDSSLSVRHAEVELIRLGAVPRAADPQAERIAGLLHGLYIIGPDVNAARVADGIISTLAIAAEAFALLMPRILVTALAAGPPAGTFLRGTTPPALPAPPKPPAKSPGNGKAPAIGTPAQWPRPKREKLEAWTAFLSYKKWCAEHGLAPASFTAFMFELTNAGVKKVEENGKAYFAF